MEGSGRFMVTAVGLNSQTGIIMTLLGATSTNDDDGDENKKNKNNDGEKKKKQGSTAKIGQDPGVLPVANYEDPKSPTPVAADSKKREIKPAKKSNKKHKSVLQLKLGKLALVIGYIGMLTAVSTFLILITRMLIVELAIKKNAWTNTYIKYILSYLIQGITVIVVAVPEGLPLAVTLALAFAVQVCRLINEYFGN